MALCSGIKADGSRCQAPAIHASAYCLSHDPAKAAERKQRASKGGRRGGRGRPVAELGALRDENASIRERLLAGELEPKVAAVAIQSLGVDTRLIDVTLKAKEQEELETRMQELEEALERQEERRAYRG
jgi:hypothetical protein